MGAGEEFRAVARLFLQRAAGYTAARWRDKAEPTYRLAQWLADTSAGMQRQPLRSVPKLDSDFALADQFAVLANDFDLALRAASSGSTIVSARLYRAATASTRQLLAG